MLLTVGTFWFLPPGFVSAILNLLIYFFDLLLVILYRLNPFKELILNVLCKVVNKIMLIFSQFKNNACQHLNLATLQHKIIVIFK